MSGTTESRRFPGLLARLRRRAWLAAGTRSLAAGLLVAAAVALFAPDPGLALPAGLGVAALTLVALRALGAAWRWRLQDVAAHLDRRFPELEESAGLLLTSGGELTDLRRWQRERIEPRWARVEAEPDRWLPRLGLGRWLALGALALVLLVAAPMLRPLLTSVFDDLAAAGETMGVTGTPSATQALQPRLLGVTVSPPAYTGLAPYTVDRFDVELPEGATLDWSLEWPGDDHLRLVISDGTDTARTVALDRATGEPGTLRGSAVIARTGLYRLERIGADGPETLPGIHTLTVNLDRPPRLRIEAPNVTRVEIPPTGPTVLAYRVTAQDDYGLGPVEIRASVASGSGEGVKFRDEVFAFDETEALDDGTAFQKTWDLLALGMAPGDEVYFFTVIRDNRAPEPNTARSDTVVVRWLDEAPPQALAEGFAIDVMPEYFKSQRQIIIETEQLIADRDSLTTEEFDDLSRALGQAQADLKDRYGQYLGDEAGEGGSPFEVPGDEAGEGEADHEDEDHEDHEDHAGEGGEAGHDHGADADVGFADAFDGLDTSGGAAELMDRFGHDHGAAEIGPITRRSPVGLMKRSVANMWEAELHLRLSDPESALPFEVEALRYLNLARQADRIYTRRLGFEPPPVSEERRLTGELDEVASRTRRVEANPDPDPDRTARALYGLLTTPGAAIDDEDRDLLRDAAAQFTERSQQRPALIRHAATLERLALGDRLEVPDCDDCLSALREATWSLLPAIQPGPDAGRRPPLDALGSEWLDQGLGGQAPASRPAPGEAP